jgi:hypothetical protein
VLLLGTECSVPKCKLQESPRTCRVRYTRSASCRGCWLTTLEKVWPSSLTFNGHVFIRKPVACCHIATDEMLQRASLRRLSLEAKYFPGMESLCCLSDGSLHSVLVGIWTGLYSVDGKGELKQKSPCHFVYHKSHIRNPGNKLVPPQ